MNNDELKKKIVEIILQGVHAEPLDNSMAIEIADALIEAGIGDVKEAERKSFVFKNELAFTIHRARAAELVAEAAAEAGFLKYEEMKHRAEVAERALDKATELAYEYRTEADTLSCSSCPMFEEIFPKCSERGLYVECSKRWKETLIEQAEKDLSEEGK
jgi:hypothetical protein|nr:MAG TPA: hypothetical protein [Caudoviricetes sp.]